MKHRAGLKDPQLRRDHLVSAEAGEADGRVARRDGDRGIDDQHVAQWSRRDRCSAATQFRAANRRRASPRPEARPSETARPRLRVDRDRRSCGAVPMRRARRRPERIQRPTVWGPCRRGRRFRRQSTCATCYATLQTLCSRGVALEAGALVTAVACPRFHSSFPFRAHPS